MCLGSNRAESFGAWPVAQNSRFFLRKELKRVEAFRAPAAGSHSAS